MNFEQLSATLEYYLFLLYDLFVPRLLQITAILQSSIHATDFNTWNPKSFLWTIAALAVIYLVVKSMSFVTSMVSTIIYMVLLSIAVQFILNAFYAKSGGGRQQNGFFNGFGNANDQQARWGF